MMNELYKVVELNPDPDLWCGSFNVDDAWEGFKVFTCFPISNLKYRTENPTQTKLVSHKIEGQIHTFTFLDDWGTECKIQVDGEKLPDQLKLLQAKVDRLPKDVFEREKSKLYRKFRRIRYGVEEVVELEELRKGDRFWMIPSSDQDFPAQRIKDVLYEAISEPKIYPSNPDWNLIAVKPVSNGD